MLLDPSFKNAPKRFVVYDRGEFDLFLVEGLVSHWSRKSFPRSHGRVVARVKDVGDMEVCS